MKEFLSSYKVIFFAIASALLFYGFTFRMDTVFGFVPEDILSVVIVIGSLPLAYTIISQIVDKKFGVDIIALFAIISSLAIGETVAAGVILLMMSGGEMLEDFAAGRARNSLKQLLMLAPQYAHMYVGGELKKVPVSDVKEGDHIFVLEQEIVPVDGVVVVGTSEINESSITGEPLLREVNPGDTLWSGSVNTHTTLEIVAIGTYAKSTYATLLRLVENAEKEKAPIVRMADRYSVFFTITVFIIALLAYIKGTYDGSGLGGEYAVAVLVVATPCPLLLAAPIAFISGMSRSAREAIIVKNGGVFESVLKVGAFIFDKTGTLTRGAPSVHSVISLDETISQSEILMYAAALEQYSVHILAESIVNEANARKFILPPVANVDEELGKYVAGEIQGKKYLIGKESYFEENNISMSLTTLDFVESARRAGETVTFLACDNKMIGVITFTDRIRVNSGVLINDLKNYKKDAQFILATGDTNERAVSIGKELGFTNIISGCLPEQKLELIKDLENKGIHSMMVGDGVNDAPALAEAYVGVALGFRGQSAATDTAEVVITVDDISKIKTLLGISQKTIRIAKESIFVGISLSFIAMGFAFFGKLEPVYGAVLQECIDVLVILNALRALR